MNNLLKIDDLRVSVEDKEILKGINLEVGPGEIHVIMGPNGAGKSTLGNAIMGNPSYNVEGGSIFFKDEDITHEAVDKRAIKGLFMSFQSPLEVPGITLSNFIRTAMENRRGKKIRIMEFRKELEAAKASLELDESYVERDLNVGFSGGEKKRAEILQLLMLKPSLAILDETDSGLDVDAIKVVSKGIQEFHKDKDASLLIITHNAAILSALKVDKVHILVDGKIIKTGDASLIDEINRDGFKQFE
ncbi:MAG: Fe-S cluster assembly ATPase SufC [Lachnospiraceae bacterium]|nr:Fe-S cluster assembly ATPase SufC [Lachnospiraceae bacterium]